MTKQEELSALMAEIEAQAKQLASIADGLPITLEHGCEHSYFIYKDDMELHDHDGSVAAYYNAVNPAALQALITLTREAVAEVREGAMTPPTPETPKALTDEQEMANLYRELGHPEAANVILLAGPYSRGSHYSPYNAIVDIKAISEKLLEAYATISTLTTELASARNDALPPTYTHATEREAGILNLWLSHGLSQEACDLMEALFRRAGLVYWDDPMRPALKAPTAEGAK